MRHHHHMPDDSIVFHSHRQYDHDLKVGWRRPTGVRISHTADPVQECRDRTCAMRRHDSQ